MKPSKGYGDVSLAKKLIKQYEGCRLTKYRCPAGKWTIGYGHRCGENQQPITLQQAEDMLDLDIKKFADELWVVLKSVTLLVSNPEFCAMLSLVFNIGMDKFKNSTLLRLYLAGEIDDAADEFLKWKFESGRESKGLLARRKAELKVFLM